jgi:hypothetical protein
MKVIGSGSRTRLLASILMVCVVVFAAIQLIHPKLDNPPVTAELKAPPEVKRILKTSCYNCHSNETHLFWFDRVAPAYWIAASDVKEARKHLNFSEIEKLPAAQQSAILYEAISQIQLGGMPLKSYTLLHPEANVSPDDLAILKNYLHPTETSTPNPAAGTAADDQYEKWIHASAPTTNVQPTLNGIAYISGYQDWKIISTTDRFDNHTTRVIFGNDVAIKAIAENNIHPWPDGTIFAKGAWAQQVDENGDTKTGQFIQVEFMIKDHQKYASTEGWGFARWRGTDLKPYGKDAAFTSECTGCHKPVRENDYVYSFPLTGQQ